MPRFNKCPNPAGKVNITNWATNRTLSRLTTLTGFARTTGGQISSGGSAGTEYYIIPDRAVASAGQLWTGSIGFKLSATLDANVFLLFLDASLNVLSAPAGGQFTATAGTPYRSFASGTAPTSTAQVGIQVSMIGGVLNTDTLQATQALLEQVGTNETYFDGDSPYASWDGTPGNSTSTLADPTPAYPVSQYGSFH